MPRTSPRPARLSACLFSLALSLCGAAQAVQLPTQAGQQLILNFDFTSQLLAAPYHGIEFKMSYTTDADPTSIHYVFYDGLNGANPSFDITLNAGFYTFTDFGFVNSWSGIKDGKFSMGLYDPSGHATVDRFQARGVIYAPPTMYTTAIVYDLAPVPEPSSVAMLAAGLTALVALKRRQQG